MKDVSYLKSYNGGILTITDEDITNETKDCSNCQLHKDLCSKDKQNDKICDQFFGFILNKGK